MKEISEVILPDDLRYAQSHEWARSQGDTVKVGISDYAQDQLGDVTYVEMPEIGASFSKGDEFGTVESVKAVSEVFIPIGGEVVAVNIALGESPGLVNQDPYGEGWLVEIRPHDPTELQTLMSRDQYLEMLKGIQ